MHILQHQPQPPVSSEQERVSSAQPIVSTPVFIISSSSYIHLLVQQLTKRNFAMEYPVSSNDSTTSNDLRGMIRRTRKSGCSIYGAKSLLGHLVETGAGIELMLASRAAIVAVFSEQTTCMGPS